MMEWFVRCIDCRSKISVDGVDWSHVNRIHLVCEECNKHHAYTSDDRRTSVTKTLTIQYRIYNTKLYSNRKITAVAIVIMVSGMVFLGLDILPLPLEILTSVFLAFTAFELGSGRVKIEYSDEDALDSIIVRHY